MRYNTIRKMDIADGPGVRVSVFFQGCEFHCKNCFNAETWPFDKGELFTDETIDLIIDLAKENHIKGLSMLGGEPMHPINIEGATKLAKKFKETYPDKNIWCWTGFKYEDLEGKAIFKYIDVLVDGQYKDELFNPKLKWKGSSNQRVIDVQKTLEKGEVVLHPDNDLMN